MRREKERKGTFDPKGQTFRMKGKTNTTYQFMAAPKNRKKGTCSWFLLIRIAIHGVKVCKERYVIKSIMT